MFSNFSRWVERQAGRSSTFVAATIAICVWALCGPFFDYSDGWQLTVNTITTIITFLMVFVIQNTQTRDTQAMQIKLDELIRVNVLARDSLIKLEERSDTEIQREREEFASKPPSRRGRKRFPIMPD